MRFKAEILRFAQDDNAFSLDVICGVRGISTGRFRLLFGEGFFGHLGEAGFDDFLEEGRGDGFVGGEPDGAFAHLELGEFGAEFVDDEVAHGEEAAMIFEGGDGADAAVMFEGGDTVADGFDGAFGTGGEDCGANFLKSGFGGFGKARVVGGDASAITGCV